MCADTTGSYGSSNSWEMMAWPSPGLLPIQSASLEHAIIILGSSSTLGGGDFVTLEVGALPTLGLSASSINVVHFVLLSFTSFSLAYFALILVNTSATFLTCSNDHFLGVWSLGLHMSVGVPPQSPHLPM